MSSPLVIVESPAKARTIARFLGDDYVVESSIGHIRDLPRNAKDVPAAYKGEKWARLGVDTENDFKPLYVVSPDKKDHVRKLKALLADASELYLATDEDREGEAIAWHLLEVLSPRPDLPVRRMVFHEITSQAIQAAIEAPREIDRRMVDAQEARRVLDRLYGYEVSPVLWKKVMPGLSAGRVQSVATRIVVERERERMAFVSAGYWDLTGTFAASGAVNAEVGAKLAELDGRKLASGRDFKSDGALKSDTVVVLDEPRATALVEDLDGRVATVSSVESKPYRRRPAAPFMTSTLQQEAGRKLRMSSAQAMRAAQSLYEAGFITYMRTDSTTLSETALRAARTEISRRYGQAFLPDGPRTYAKKVKNAQEAHEAIRPAGDDFKSPEEVAAQVNPSEARVYDLVWKRTVASQMTDATGETVTVRLDVEGESGTVAVFSTSGTVIAHPGFQKAYEESTDEDVANDAATDDRDRRLPPLIEGDRLDVRELTRDGHETQPPARYTEASLVKRLEELGVGRPSTYASIMGTIQDRGYVWKKGSALVPSFTAFSVVGLLEQHFPDMVDYAFTARMEDDLDSIAAGEAESIPWLHRFYFGEEDDPGLRTKVSERLAEIDAAAINTIPLGVDENGVGVVAKPGRYGPYVKRGEDTASIPEDIPPDELTIDLAIELIEAPSGDRELGVHPRIGLPIILKNGRFGPYVQMGEHDDETGEKPKTSSLFSTMDPETVGLDQAVQLLSLPRTVGVDPTDGEAILALNGRYGPYVKKGSESRSLETESQLFSVTLDEARALLAQPRERRGRQTKPPLRELGNDLVSGKPMVVKDGRFGPYVTDGEVNASLRKGDDVETISDERASELLQMRRDRGPVKKKAKKKAAKKKATEKKATKKKATKKKATVKPAAKKKAGTEGAENPDK